MRYQITYAKTDNILITWRRTAEEAAELAAKLRAVGYVVTVLDHDGGNVTAMDI